MFFFSRLRFRVIMRLWLRMNRLRLGVIIRLWFRMNGLGLWVVIRFWFGMVRLGLWMMIRLMVIRVYMMRLRVVDAMVAGQGAEAVKLRAVSMNFPKKSKVRPG